MTKLMKPAAIVILVFAYAHLTATAIGWDVMNAATRARLLWQWQASCKLDGGAWHSENQTCVKVGSVAR